MGAGKTTLIKEICRQINVTDAVTSPTFAIVNEYHRTNGKPVFHFDFYRINKLDEVYDLGYEEYFYSDSLCLVEWPEKIEQLLPNDTVTVKIKEIDNGKRIITIEK
jgi:tRNA threonylcarbamoyladenosine biosynthesis protein TsaE